MQATETPRLKSLDMPGPFGALADLVYARGDYPLKKWKGLYHCRIDKQWEVWINGHKEELPLREGTGLPAFHAYVEYNGWPAGVFSPISGVIAASECANEETFCAAVKAATARVQAARGPGDRN